MSEDSYDKWMREVYLPEMKRLLFIQTWSIRIGVGALVVLAITRLLAGLLQ